MPRAALGEFSSTGGPGEPGPRELDSGLQFAQALARHVKAALLLSRDSS